MNTHFFSIQSYFVARISLCALCVCCSTVKAVEVAPKVLPAKGLISEDKNELVFCVSLKRPTGLTLAQAESVISANGRMEFLEAIARYLQMGSNCTLSLEGAYCVRQQVDQSNNICTVNWRIPRSGIRVVSINHANTGGVERSERPVQQAALPKSHAWRHNPQDYETELGRLKETFRASLEGMSTQVEPEYGLAVASLGEWALKTISEIADEAGRNPRLLREERKLISARIQDLEEEIKKQGEQAACRYE
jgi:hypothetical protein